VPARGDLAPTALACASRACTDLVVIALGLRGATVLDRVEGLVFGQLQAVTAISLAEGQRLDGRLW
jgi:hypothetical protein